ncbi:copper amine oxidase [Paenibacillus sp. IB182496]|uniref:Copper amine oxidase n=1 Tax=Paenibacillus sabuli TaxID=2772509 RepID=A0A927BT04_9BACL|nr:stalk domain-containing protein [Paenibacillus sabuli]MBD2846237.1 copper amine oxidase [Paenibacillus sabuli]
MKLRKLVVLVLLISLWGGTMMFADSATRQVRTLVNGTALDQSGLLIENSTYLPLRQVATSLQAIVIWDDDAKQAKIYKPNVHMLLLNEQGKTFGAVNSGANLSFEVWAQVDSLKIPISKVKIVIANLSGQEKVIYSEGVDAFKEDFFLRTQTIDYRFAEQGNYKIRFYVMPEQEEDWFMVSEKAVISN